MINGFVRFLAVKIKLSNVYECLNDAIVTSMYQCIMIDSVSQLITDRLQKNGVNSFALSNLIFSCKEHHDGFLYLICLPIAMSRQGRFHQITLQVNLFLVPACSLLMPLCSFCLSLCLSLSFLSLSVVLCLPVSV